MLVVPNRDVIIPQGEDIYVQVPVNTGADRRFENRARFNFSSVTFDIEFIDLKFVPVCDDWLEVFVDGLRLINPRVTSVEGGVLYESYNTAKIAGYSVRWREPVNDFRSSLPGQIQLDDRFLYRVDGKIYTAEEYLVDPLNPTTSPRALRWSIEQPSTGWAVYDRTSKKNYIYTGTIWIEFTAAQISPGKSIQFSKPISGIINVVCDSKPVPDARATVIPVQNIQGRDSARAALWVEPVIMTEPANGYARLSLDRSSMVYLPKRGYVGEDTFTYCLINNLGQYSRNYCVYVTVE